MEHFKPFCFSSIGNSFEFSSLTSNSWLVVLLLDVLHLGSLVPFNRSESVDSFSELVKVSLEYLYLGKTYRNVMSPTSNEWIICFCVVLMPSFMKGFFFYLFFTIYIPVGSWHLLQLQSKYHPLRIFLFRLKWPYRNGTYWMVISSPWHIFCWARTLIT